MRELHSVLFDIFVEFGRMELRLGRYSEENFQANVCQLIVRATEAAGPIEYRQRAVCQLARDGMLARASSNIPRRIAPLSRGTLIEAARPRISQELIDCFGTLMRCSGEGSAVESLRREAVFAMGELGGEKEAAELLNLLQSERSDQVRFSALHSLNSIGGSGAVEGLIWTLKHQDEALRYDALFYMRDHAEKLHKVKPIQQPTREVIERLEKGLNSHDADLAYQSMINRTQKCLRKGRA